jgi:RNA polymerase sigma factor (sigma-70 family)
MEAVMTAGLPEGADEATLVADEVWVARAGRGDHDAFTVLVRRYQARVYRFILRTTACPEDALDLTQETFVSAFRALPRWRPEAKFRTWLFRIASNASVDYLRARRLWTYVPIDEVEHCLGDGSDMGSALDSHRQFARLVDALQGIPAVFRQALLLREVEGMSYQEIAEALDTNEGTVKSRIARARQALAAVVRGGK